MGYELFLPVGPDVELLRDKGLFISVKEVGYGPERPRLRREKR